MTSAVLTSSDKGGATSDALVQALAGPKAAAVSAAIIFAHLAIFMMGAIMAIQDYISWDRLIAYLVAYLASAVLFIGYELFKLHELSVITRNISAALSASGRGQPDTALKQADEANLPRLARIHSIRFFVFLAVAVVLGALTFLFLIAALTAS